MKTLFSKENINNIINEISQKIMNNYKKDEEIIIISLLKGAFIFTADLIRKIDRTIIIDFMIVSSYGDKFESSNKIDIKYDINIDIENKNVIIIDDIVDTGNTLYEIKNYLLKKNPKKIELCCLLDKSQRREKNINIDYIGFKCPNEFVIGYGIDTFNKYRNLPFVASLYNEL